MWEVIGHLPTWMQGFIIIGGLVLLLIPILGLTYWVVKKMDKLKLPGGVEAEDSTKGNDNEHGLPITPEVKK
jgi:hypothetical protein